MSIMMNIPPVLEAQTASLMREGENSLESLFVEYLWKRLQESQKAKGAGLIRKLRAIRAEQPKLEGAPYRFRRQDAYEEELA